jgi:hypothetical protein
MIDSLMNPSGSGFKSRESSSLKNKLWNRSDVGFSRSEKVPLKAESLERSIDVRM